jgi:hypothetical protein
MQTIAGLCLVKIGRSAEDSAERAEFVQSVAAVQQFTPQFSLGAVADNE